MPALIKVTPEQFKEILVLDGWRVHQEDERNWSLVKPASIEILELPKSRVLAYEVMYHALSVAEMPPGRYLELREQCLASTILPGQRQLFFPIGDNYFQRSLPL